MAIKIDCPRCKQNLLVPNQKAGGYANCPRCTGRFWVPKDAVSDSSLMEAITLAGSAVAPPRSNMPAPPTPPAGFAAAVPLAPPAPPRVYPGTAAPRPAPPPAPPRTYAGPTAPPPAPPPARSGRKVAHLISAEAAQSVLTPTADGRLPDLQLAEGEQTEKRPSQSSSVNPLVLFGLLSMSVVLSVVLALVDWDSSDSGNAAQQDSARRFIEDTYFGGGSLDRGELKPYQVYLREAQRAHTGGDLKIERERYRKVLDLLHAERAKSERGLTGSRSDDKELESRIRTILSGS